ncbi:MAG: AAA family ATPase, partial [Nitrospira sp.]|nr:AAA family ATPase [Nitrospira sp.]
LDPIERANSLERIENGSAHILYIAPESLRSKTIERLLLRRNVVRFVIDEAHCLSSWGHDFRVDYLYIGDFIKLYQTNKQLDESIPVSCFTATAKPQVINDIQEYFKEKINITLDQFISNESRKNLHYRVYEKTQEEDKYATLRDLIEDKNCPTIVYVSRTRRAEALAERLTRDGYPAKPYHGQMDKKEKSENQDAFLRGDFNVIVATSAFGMGVDKDNVGLVIHYEISDSLENYIQESGRAGRNESISAECLILFNDDDLSKHFVLLNQTKLNVNEIQQVWSAIKDLTRFRAQVSQSALEIARKAGWDEGIIDVETRIQTAIAALEDSGYLKRGQNSPRTYANSILVKSAQDAIQIINNSNKFTEIQKQQANRIITSLISSRSRSRAGTEEAESRVDYLSDRLGIERAEVIRIINLLREEKILGDTKDLTAFITRKDNKNHSLHILESYSKIEKHLLSIMDDVEKTYDLKEINEQAEENGCNTNPEKIRTIINYLAIKNLIKKHNEEFSRNHITIFSPYPKEKLEEQVAQRHELSRFIINYLYEKSETCAEDHSTVEESISVEFSELELKEVYESRPNLFKTEVTSQQVEDALLYLSRIEALSIEGGFLVVYNAMSIERLELDSKKRYKVEDFRKLKQFYQSKMQQIHIVGEYARKLIEDYRSALEFVDDYFKLNYNSFLRKYFKGTREKEIGKTITRTKYEQLFGELSPSQLKIVNDNESSYIVVAAGPGSGKTKILVHKLASLLLMEDVKPEQLLMLTFSRAAATEFKKRLIKLIGSTAYYVEIKTFHSYCFDLMGKRGSIAKSDEIIRETVKSIKNGELKPGGITKTVLVLDEAQDIDADEFALINTLIEINEGMRVIAVGD